MDEFVFSIDNKIKKGHGNTFIEIHDEGAVILVNGNKEYLLGYKDTDAPLRAAMLLFLIENEICGMIDSSTFVRSNIHEVQIISSETYMKMDRYDLEDALVSYLQDVDLNATIKKYIL